MTRNPELVRHATIPGRTQGLFVHDPIPEPHAEVDRRNAIEAALQLEARLQNHSRAGAVGLKELGDVRDQLGLAADGRVADAGRDPALLVEQPQDLDDSRF